MYTYLASCLCAVLQSHLHRPSHIRSHLTCAQARYKDKVEREAQHGRVLAEKNGQLLVRPRLARSHLHGPTGTVPLARSHLHGPTCTVPLARSHLHDRAQEKIELLLVRPHVCVRLRTRVCTRAFACVRECVRDLRMGVTGSGADVAAVLFGSRLAAQCKVTPSTCHAARSVHRS